MKRFFLAAGAAVLSATVLTSCSSSPEAVVSPPSSPMPVPVAPSGSVTSGASITPEATIVAGALPDDAKITLTISRYGTVTPSEQSTLDLSITKKEASILVVDKGETVMNETVATDPALWNQLSTSYAEIENLPSSTNCGVGGPSETLTVTSGAETLTEVTIQGCEGVEVGLGETALEEFVNPALPYFTPPPPASPSASAS